jgi:putative AdoMet-dependent methyltransferase
VVVIIMIMKSSFPADEFNKWAPTYNIDILSGGFPFTGYESTLDKIVTVSIIEPGMQILDLGVGTGNLTERFLASGCKVTGLDFSSEMLSIAKSKYPTAKYLQADLRSEPSQFISGVKFDRIVSAYTFHHFSLPEKYLLLRKFMPFLLEHGFFVIGDIAFDDSEAMHSIKKTLGKNWEDEKYWLTDQSINYLSKRQMQVGFTRTSVFAGVFKIKSHVNLR